MKTIDSKPWTVNERHRGEFTDASNAVVMDNTADRNHLNRIKVSYFITTNEKLLAGNNTVAVFRIKKQSAVPGENSTL